MTRIESKLKYNIFKDRFYVGCLELHYNHGRGDQCLSKIVKNKETGLYEAIEIEWDQEYYYYHGLDWHRYTWFIEESGIYHIYEKNNQEIREHFFEYNADTDSIKNLRKLKSKFKVYHEYDWHGYIKFTCTLIDYKDTSYLDKLFNEK